MRTRESLLLRIARFQSEEKFMQTVFATAEANWKTDFDQGSTATGSAIQKSFSAYLKAQTSLLSDGSDGMADPGNISRMRTQAWAAHFLPHTLYEIFLRESLSNPFQYGGMHSVSARAAVKALRGWTDQRKVSPKSKLMTVEEKAAREAWRNSVPIVSYRSAPEDIERAFADFSADDLHEIAHGEDISDAPLVGAVARHPNCDWGSACEILHSFSAAAYQTYWRDGRTEDSFSQDEQRLFQAFQTIADRAKEGSFRTSAFRHNWRPDQEEPPENWIKWSIPQRNLGQSGGQVHRPNIVVAGGKIRPIFEVWQRQQSV